MNATDHRLLVHDGTFAVLGPAGDITGVRGNTPDGLFLRDARHLSRWQLTVDGSSPTVLVPAMEGDDDGVATAVLTPHDTREEPSAYTVFREQVVIAGALVERIRLTSNLGEPTTARLAVTADADFADQFELRTDHRWYTKTHAVRTRQPLPNGVEFGYRRGEWRSRTTVTADPPPAAVDETGSSARQLCWLLDVPPHGTAELRLRVTAFPCGATRPADGDEACPPPGDPAEAAARVAADRNAFLADDANATATGESPATGAGATAGPGAPSAAGASSRARAGAGPSAGAVAGTDWPALDRACAQGLSDLAGLRVTVAGPEGEPLRVPGAGVPWFLTLFGRDALLTSLFALPYRPRLAEATLLALSAAQADTDDPGRLARPGKIVHEVRHGELAHFEQVPYGRYYGSVDVTPLYLVLLGAYVEQSGEEGLALARRLEKTARRAVDWMFRHGGLTAHGYLAYEAHEGGLANQCWKDSPGAVCAADGTRPEGAVMVAQVQGYAYDALCRTAELARRAWADPEYAQRLERAAEELRARFTTDFWLPGERFFALALDGGGMRADALASDAGHLLWSGILDRATGETVGRRLLEPDFFSGWGIRTLAAGQAPYHPLSYHRGSIWPHDNAVIALGLARYGLREEARTVARGLLEAAARHGHRLPEVLAGYARDEHPSPVPYPHACSPQAWAAAAPLALRTAVTS